MLTPARLAVAVALGAVTTLVVAWWLAVLVTVQVSAPSPVTTQGVYRGVDGGRWSYRVYERGGLTVVVRERARRRMILSDGELVPGYEFRYHGWRVVDGMPVVSGPAMLADDDIPAWARQPRSRAPAAGPPSFTAASGRGWPCRALWYEATMSPGSRVNRGGIELPPSFREIGPGPVLPYRIIPAGFAADTVVFGAAWLLLLAAPGLARRAARHREGLCLACGYDLRHASHGHCPECGAASGDARALDPLGWSAWVHRST